LILGVITSEARRCAAISSRSSQVAKAAAGRLAMMFQRRCRIDDAALIGWKRTADG
jgi:hypothetical protein